MTSEAKALAAPLLPTTIDGDGRYVMSLLNDFCTEVADEVNRANGLDTDPKTAVIDNFFVSFDREGILWRWDALEGAAYYELTAGPALLTHTTDTVSRIAPPSFSGTVTLSAYLADGSVIRKALDYTKPRPLAPTNVTLSRTTDGTLITYDSIPSDCIGAQITAGGKTYRTTESTYLFPHTESARLGEITVSYYDCFGTGESTVIVSDVAAVTGFFAEQNGEWLDLFWDSLPIYGARYVVKVAYRSPDWDSALTLTTVQTTHARLRFPQSGAAYFLIKAFDAYGNTSADAAWTTLDRASDYRRNVIVTLDQSSSAYNGTKTNLYYDAVADGLRLGDGSRRGEYLFAVHLPEAYRARNWLESKIIGVTDDTLCWDDSTFNWTSEDAEATVWNGACGDIGGAILTHQIAEATEPSEGETVWTMDTTLLSTDDAAPTEAQQADTFLPARWANGLSLTPLTRLTYDIDECRTFGLVFHLAADSSLADCEIVSLFGADGALTLRFTQGTFRLCGSDGEVVSLPYRTDERDYLAVGIEQTDKTRTLRLSSLAQKISLMQQADAEPCAYLTSVSWYPR